MSTEQIKPGYKWTEVGVIPEDWEVDCLGSLVKITSGVSPSVVSFTSDGYPYFKVDQLNNSDKYIGTKHTPYHFKNGPRVDRGSIVFAKRGAAIASNKVRILRDEAFMDTNLMALTPNQFLRSEYLFYALSKTGLWQFADTTSVPQINNKHIKPLEFSRPGVDEQDLIVAALSDIDALLAKLDQLIAKKRDQKQATMQQLLTGQTRLPGFSGDWEVKRLGGMLAYLGNGAGYKPASSFGFPVTRIETIADGAIDFSRVGYAVPTDELNKYRLKKGDILFSHINSIDHIGKVAIYESETALYHGMNLLLLRPSEAVLSRYLFYWLGSRQGRKQSATLAKQAVSQASINTVELKGLELLLPTVDEQTAIAAVLYDLDAELATLEARRDKTHEIKKGMMRELLTGKVRLPLSEGMRNE